MCGIVGYIGQKDASAVLMNGLRRMEYRGYDSAGIALMNGKPTVLKRQGKISVLAEAVDKAKLKGHTGIGHTRWATHGAPSELNAHPHQAGPVTIVHNGIIENYAELKTELAAKGAKFQSETDTEVLAHLIAQERETAESLEAAVLAALLQVKGTFGLLVLCEREPGKIVAARRGSPLLLGIGQNELYLASDATAIVGYTDRVIYLEDDEIAVCTADGYRIIDFEAKDRQHEEHEIKLKLEAIEKNGHDHFLLKEIMEQPRTITDILRGRLDQKDGTSHLGGLNFDPEFMQNLNGFLTIACGTSYYAGLHGRYLLERMTGLPVNVEFADEFRYRDPIVSPDNLGIIITQSGETADTLAGLRELKRRNIRTLGLVNVVGSSVAREVDGGVYLHAGPEISVASTKAFSAQVIAQLLVGLSVARSRSMGVTQGQEIVKALEILPQQVQSLLDRREEIKQLAKKLAHFNNVIFLGRDSLYPVGLEGSHKLKEVSYIHAEAYAAGQMKHGAGALIDENMLLVFLNPRNELYDKSRSNLEEVRARHGRLLVLGTEGDHSLREFSEDILTIPECSPWTQGLLANIPLQLFAYYMAVERGTDVDQPRNLAKSVTVE